MTLTYDTDFQSHTSYFLLIPNVRPININVRGGARGRTGLGFTPENVGRGFLIHSIHKKVCKHLVRGDGYQGNSRANSIVTGFINNTEEEIVKAANNSHF